MDHLYILMVFHVNMNYEKKCNICNNINIDHIICTWLQVFILLISSQKHKLIFLTFLEKEQPFKYWWRGLEGLPFYPEMVGCGVNNSDLNFLHFPYYQI